MSLTFIPGYLGTITINSDDLSLIGQVYQYDAARTALGKPTFGSESRKTIGGMVVHTIGCSGHVAAEEMAALFAIFDAAQPIPYEIQFGDAAGTTDGGKVSGNFVVSRFTIDGDAEGQVSWAMEGEGDGDRTYTAPTP